MARDRARARLATLDVNGVNYTIVSLSVRRYSNHRRVVLTPIVDVCRSVSAEEWYHTAVERCDIV